MKHLGLVAVILIAVTQLRRMSNCMDIRDQLLKFLDEKNWKRVE